MVSKKYHIYYLVIIPIIRFLIGHQPFTLYLVYTLIWHYLIDNSENLLLDNKDKQIYEEIHIADG